jgi:hypothetical protein
MLARSLCVKATKRPAGTSADAGAGVLAVALARGRATHGLSGPFDASEDTPVLETRQPEFA